MAEIDYWCRRSPFGKRHFLLTILKDAYIQTGLPEEDVPHELLTDGKRPSKEVEMLYEHITGCEPCRSFYYENLPFARNTVARKLIMVR